MTRIQRVLIAFVAALFLAPLPAKADYITESDALLEASQVKTLPPAALSYYQQAEKAFDHIDRDGGVRYLEMAAKEAPDSLPLQFILALRARQRARFYYGVKALKLYDIAEEAVQRVLKQPIIESTEKRNAEELLKSIQAERENLPTNDKKKADIGFQAIVKPLAIERAKISGHSPSLETEAAATKKRADSAAALGGASSTKSTTPISHTGFSPTGGATAPTSSDNNSAAATSANAGSNPFGAAPEPPAAAPAAPAAAPPAPSVK